MDHTTPVRQCRGTGLAFPGGRPFGVLQRVVVLNFLLFHGLGTHSPARARASAVHRVRLLSAGAAAAVGGWEGRTWVGVHGEWFKGAQARVPVLLKDDRALTGLLPGSR